MKFKMLLTTAALVLAPAFAANAACSGHEKQVMSCAEGSVYDAETGSCKVMSS
ncbi:chitin-binding domain-containing protein [Thalassococcus lentus]|uniref:Adenylosuccinate lyase n=1 Tax=Thalassococcus lentus TaxID=1210524 RepID=A0ABT4XRE8_9RHOB|nr:chitin-binding domain-containing protein [Thalassococcus lentus]MDA7424518.1 adenylosuccinate lyase [Thalassococcus lentus]